MIARLVGWVGFGLIEDEGGSLKKEALSACADRGYDRVDRKWLR